MTTSGLPDGGRKPWTVQLETVERSAFLSVQVSPNVNAPPFALVNFTVPVGMRPPPVASATVAVQVSVSEATM